MVNVRQSSGNNIIILKSVDTEPFFNGSFYFFCGIFADKSFKSFFEDLIFNFEDLNGLSKEANDLHYEKLQLEKEVKLLESENTVTNTTKYFVTALKNNVHEEVVTKVVTEAANLAYKDKNYTIADRIINTFSKIKNRIREYLGFGER